MRSRTRQPQRTGKVNIIEEADAIFTINFPCPHCGKALAISLDKVKVEVEK